MAARNKERLERLAALIQERGVLHLKDAARALGVSEMTVRRDIADETARFAYLGGHIMPAQAVEPEAPYELARAADRHADAKRRTCRHALAQVGADDTIFIDCGTTLMHLIDLMDEDMPLTVVCYALNTAERLARNPNWRLILLGGLYYPASASFSGAPGLETMEILGINTAFLSAAGLDERRGITCAHFHEVPVKQKALTMAQKAFLVIDSSKIDRVKPAFFARTEAFDAIYTEDGTWHGDAEERDDVNSDLDKRPA